ncbi:4349b44f-4a16-42aa-8fbf-cdbdeb8822fe [Thermothielavioides terrestris]|nr:4349b44f-4a16-42aa-8fbf-cdbdeb8822fe [Thermothielavioides terrestris]
MASDGSAAVGAADIASAEAASPCPPGEREDRSPPPGPALHLHIQGPSPSSSSNPLASSTPGLPHESPTHQRQAPFPLSLPSILFQLSKAPSAAIVPSTAEGRPVPLADAADSRRTSALQKLNSKYPSVVRRHGYAPEASGAQSSTYSQPVIVRTYSGPSPSQGSRGSRSRNYRPPSSSRGVSRRVPLPSSSAPGGRAVGPGQPIQPTVTDVGVGTTSSISAEPREGDDYGVSMPPPYKPEKAPGSSSSKLSLPWPWKTSSQAPEEPKLPPLEAFSFKSFMADLQTPGGENDIGADLDRIAEICARSRYSLSNQYEVHVAPHGSGALFASGIGPSPSSAPRRKGHSHSRSRSYGQSSGGPTLQAITSDDENSAQSHPRRRNGNRRRSAAYGTLETIMSSSRSSEEDKTKKKSAAELVGEVRGRAAKKAWATNNPSESGSGSGSGTASASASASASTGNGGNVDAQAGQPPTADGSRLAGKKPASFATAIMDNGCSSANTNTSSSSRLKPAAATATSSSTSPAATSALHSEPAQPQTSPSHLGVRTAPSAPTQPHAPDGEDGHPPRGPVAGSAGLPQQRASPAPAGIADALGSWAAWIPWRTPAQVPGDHRHHHNHHQQQYQQEEQQGQSSRQTQAGGSTAPAPAVSNAEGSLRQLLRSAAAAGDAPGKRSRAGGAGG